MILPAPTALGWRAGVFYAVLVGAYFAAPYSNLFFLLLAFLSVLAVLNVVWTFRNLRGVAGRIAAFEPSPAGAGQPFHADLKAPGARRYQVRCMVDLRGHGLIAAPVPLLEGAARADGDLPSLPRGLYPVRAAWVESSYPLGLLRVKRSVEAPEELIVYPAPADLPEARNGSELMASLAGALSGGEGSQQPAGLRAFRPGDELRSVHWRATARRGELVVKEWEGDAAAGLEVVVDRRTDLPSLEAALSLVSALALNAREHKERLTVHSQGLSTTFGSEHTAWEHLFKFLAGAQTLPASDPAPPRTSPSVLRLPLRHTEGRT